ncbi:hypothetical protein FHG87_006740 [Trinorchestia longiramus]|nr:hypothetical protein FHG87_006740 [Trinorchestia longiramus]
MQESKSSTHTTSTHTTSIHKTSTHTTSAHTTSVHTTSAHTQNIHTYIIQTHNIHALMAQTLARNSRATTELSASLCAVNCPSMIRPPILCWPNTNKLLSTKTRSKICVMHQIKPTEDAVISPLAGHFGALWKLRTKYKYILWTCGGVCWSDACTDASWSTHYSTYINADLSNHRHSSVYLQHHVLCVKTRRSEPSSEYNAHEGNHDPDSVAVASAGTRKL